MDIQQAKDFLSGMNITLQKQIDANTLAIQILDETFQAEFTSRDLAVQQVSGLISEKEALQTAKNMAIADKDAIIAEKEEVIAEKEGQLQTQAVTMQEVLAEKERLAEEVVAKEARIAELEAENTELKKPVEILEEEII